MDEAEHVCNPVSLYFCPAAGEVESSCCSGFGQCCDRPEAHVPMPDGPGTEAVSQALSEAAKREYRLQRAIDRVQAVCTRLAPEQPDPTDIAVAYSSGWNDALDAVQTAITSPKEV